jgi:lysophospholipase L1-like esterase
VKYVAVKVLALQALIWMGLYAVHLKDPFPSLRWNPILYPPGATLRWMGLAVLLLALSYALLVIWLRRAGRPSSQIASILLGLALLNSLMLERACLEINKTRVFFRPHPLLHHVALKNNPRLPSNSMGLRYEEIPRDRQEGEVRVVVIGDSSAHGVWVPYESRFSSVLERELRRRHPGRLIRVVNAATPGYTSLLGVRHARLSLYDLEPDFFQISFNNDTGLGPGLDSQVLPWTNRSRLQCYLYESELYLLLRKLLVNGLSPARTPLQDTKPRMTPAEMAACYNELLAYSARRGFRSVILQMPLPVTSESSELKRYHRIQETAAATHHGEVVDCFNLFLRQGFNDAKWFVDPCHPTVEGHQAIAEELIKAFEERSLLVPSTKRSD